MTYALPIILFAFHAGIGWVCAQRAKDDVVYVLCASWILVGVIVWVQGTVEPGAVTIQMGLVLMILVMPSGLGVAAGVIVARIWLHLKPQSDAQAQNI